MMKVTGCAPTHFIQILLYKEVLMSTPLYHGGDYNPEQ